MHYVTKVEEINGFSKDLISTDVISLDIESTGLDAWDDELLLIQAKVNNNIYIFDTKKIGSKLTKYVVSLIKDSKKECIGHNIKFDIKFLERKTGELITNVYDTMIVEQILFAGLSRKMPSLDELVEKYCNRVLDKTVRKTFINAEEITQEQLIYAASDVTYLEEIKAKQLKDAEEKKLRKVVDLENMLLPVVASMEINGVKLNQEHWLKLEKLYIKKAKESEKNFIHYIISNVDFSNFKNTLECADFFAVFHKKTIKETEFLTNLTEPKFMEEWFIKNFNIGSSYQVKAVLQKITGLDIKSTGEKVVAPYAHKHEIVRLLLDFREASKKVSTYGAVFLKHVNKYTGRVHADFNQMGTATGRFSSDTPNMQNIPADSDETPDEESYRAAFIAEEGNVVITSDYSQAELRLLAVVSGEQELINGFIRGDDAHKVAATKLYHIPIEEVTKDQRRRGKTLNFAVVYGTSKYGLLYNFGIPLKEGEELLNNYFAGFPTLDNFISLGGKRIEQLLYSVTPFGRKRFFEKKVIYKDSRERERYLAGIRREGINHIIQGGSADMVKLAMIKIFYGNPWGDKLRILIQVHDEIVCEVADDIKVEARKFILKCMEGAGEIFLKEVPAVVDSKISYRWSK